MKCSKTQQSLIELKTGNEAKAMSVVDAYSPEEAVLVAKKMFQRECAGWGDEERAHRWQWQSGSKRRQATSYRWWSGFLSLIRERRHE